MPSTQVSLPRNPKVATIRRASEVDLGEVVWYRENLMIRTGKESKTGRAEFTTISGTQFGQILTLGPTTGVIDVRPGTTLEVTF